MCFDGFCLERDNWGPWGKRSPGNSATPILHILNIQTVHNTYSIWYEWMWTETYILWNRFNWRVAMVWYGSTVTLIYIIISGIFRSLQTYIDKLSGENTIVIKVRFMQHLWVNEVWGSTLWEQVKPHTIRFGTDTCYIEQTVSSKLAIRSVPNSVVELSRGYSIIMKSFRSMHAQNKFYYKGVRDRHIVASVAEFSV